MYDQSRDYLKYPTFGTSPQGLPVIGDPEEEYPSTTTYSMARK